MAGNHVLLETIQLTQSASSVVFNNIPQSGYTDLKIVMSTRAADSANNWYLTKVQFNTDTTSGNYSSRIVAGFGSTAFSGTNTFYAGYVPSGARTANTFGNNEIYIPNYTGSTAKSFSVDSVTEGNGTSFEILGLWAGLWSGTAAINQIVLSPDTGSWAANSTFSLYGLAAVGTTPAVAPKATGGNIVANDGTYWYHAFLSSGNFVPQTPLTCDILQIAGGGAGGGQNAGGGGAGGLLAFTSQSLSTTNYACTIGAGGTSVYQGSTTNGNNSQFGSLTASVGGGAGGFFWGGGSGTAQAGGSGGGAAGIPNNNLNGGAGTAGQGNAGGSTTTSVNSYAGAGGGGAGAAGNNSVANEVGGAGGIGATSSLINGIGAATNTGQLSSGNYYFAGGGGGGGGTTSGAGGLGGGGAGRDGAVAFAGTANTGGGGGGARGANAGGNGGSGIVIIRYAMA